MTVGKRLPPFSLENPRGGFSHPLGGCAHRTGPISVGVTACPPFPAAKVTGWGAEYKRTRTDPRRSRTRRRGRQTTTGQPEGDLPLRETLCPAGLPGPLALGSLTDPLEQPHAPSPTHPQCPRWAAASMSKAQQGGPGLSSPLPHTERVLRGFRTTTRPQRCRPTPGQTHRAVAQVAGSSDTGASGEDTETQHAGTGPSGGGGRTPGCRPWSPGPAALRGQKARLLSSGGEGPSG